MTDYIRRLVSGNKARFKDHELKLELDLVYVTDQVIIMGYPASGIEGLYRNRREDALRFLESRHGKNYWVFNFCPIKENSYDGSVFGGRVSRYPFPDHHAPPLAIMPLVAREVRAWLSGSPDRVAVLHCKAGKGRSGTMACSYLVSLDDSPAPPQLHRTQGGKDLAKRRIEGAIDALPPDEETPLQSANIIPPPSPTSPLLRSQGHGLSDAENILSVDSGAPTTEVTIPEEPLLTSSPLLSSSANPERSFTDALKGVLDLHTAKRMKPLGESKSGDGAKDAKIKQGVSIPSQRRFLYYWALLLAHEAPRHLWAVDSPLSSLPLPIPDDPSIRPPFRPSQAPHPKIRLTQIKLRMRESGGVKMNIVKAANRLIEKTSLAKGPGRPLESEEAERKKDATKSPSTSNQIWASLARYDDTLVDTLERWEVYTRDIDGHMGKRRKGSEHLLNGSAEGEHLNDIFKGEKWDGKKMVRSFARLAVSNKGDEEVVEDKDGKISVYTLHPLSDKRWEGLKKDIHHATEHANNALVADQAHQVGVSKSEANSMYDVSSASALPQEVDRQARATLEKGVVLDAGREIRVKLYMGQVFMGWLWFVPTFHMPQPPPTASQPSSSTTATLHLTRKEIDFPLGVGSGIIDVDIDMEWVTPPPSTSETASTSTSSLPQNAVEIIEPPLNIPSGQNSVDSEMDVKQTTLGATMRAVVGGIGNEGTIREVVEAGQGDKGA